MENGIAGNFTAEAQRTQRRQGERRLLLVVVRQAGVIAVSDEHPPIPDICAPSPLVPRSFDADSSLHW
jgi:hypothetical protein